MKKILLNIILCGLLFFSCDAPRENPLDPDNPDNIFGSLTGVVRTIKVPNEPLSGVNVFWSEANIIVQTNADGTFTIEDLKPTDGFLFFEKNGYSRDSLQVNWSGRKTVNVVQQLNSIPKLVDGSLTSSVENRFPETQVYKLNIDAQIIDEENDVDSVFIMNDELQFTGNLNNVSSTQFQQEFTPAQMKLSSVDDIIGKEFYVIAKDANGKTFNIAQLSVKRIIKELVETIFPSNNETVSDSLILNWKRFTPGYSFTYSLSIFTNTVGPDLVWSTSDISSDEIFYEVADNINPGEYFWVVSVIDEFGNRARSRPASFIFE